MSGDISWFALMRETVETRTTLIEKSLNQQDKKIKLTIK